MSHWNHRVIDQELDEPFLSIHEVYYDDDGKITAYTVDAIDVCGEDLESLRQTLDWMLEATAKPILKKSELPGG